VPAGSLDLGRHLGSLGREQIADGGGTPVARKRKGDSPANAARPAGYERDAGRAVEWSSGRAVEWSSGRAVEWSSGRAVADLRGGGVAENEQLQGESGAGMRSTARYLQVRNCRPTVKSLT
jgi:hypothetical protein